MGPRAAEVVVVRAGLGTCSTSLSIGHPRSQWCAHEVLYTHHPPECPKTTVMFHQDILRTSANEGTSTQVIQCASDSQRAGGTQHDGDSQRAGGCQRNGNSQCANGT